MSTPLSFHLSPKDLARRESLIRSAWLGIVKGFHCRPQPRSAWDHAADNTEARWEKVLEPMRRAVQSAVFIGNQQLIEQTMEGCRDFLRALEADLASLIPVGAEESVQALAISEGECSGPVKVEEMRLISSPTPSEAERAVGIFSKEMSALAQLESSCERLARTPSERRRA